MKDHKQSPVVVEKDHVNDLSAFAKDYLVHFGYMTKCRDSPRRLCKHVSRALQQFQIFYRLADTGTLTLQTMKLMKLPRCPVRDFEPGELGGLE